MLHTIVIPVFAIILVGYLLGIFYKKLNVDAFVFLLVYITAPSLIFTSMARSNLEFKEFLTIFFITSLVILSAGFLVYLIFKIFKVQHKGLYLPMTIGNTGYLGYPLSLAAFGAAGLSRAIVYDVTTSVYLYSVGIFIAHEKNEFKEIFKVPLIYALVFGIAFNFFKLPIPDLVFAPLEKIGSITIPLALIVLGYRLTTIKISHFKTSLFSALFKIAGGFGIAFLFVSLFNVAGVTKSVILLEAAMPSAVMSMVICHKYNRDPEIVASVVMISTIISMITIPLMLLII